MSKQWCLVANDMVEGKKAAAAAAAAVAATCSGEKGFRFSI